MSKLFKQFLRNPIQIGTVVPSSNILADFITDSAELHQKQTVVELGPGNGVITRAILNRITSGVTFFALELNTELAKEAALNCPDANIYNASALEIREYLIKHDKDASDCIISALPWSGFNKDYQENLLESIYNALYDGGAFLTIVYITGFILPSAIRFRKLLKNRFSEVRRSKIIWGNVFPAVVYHCVK